VIFAAPWFLAGSAVALLFGVILFIGALRADAAKKRFGDDPRVMALTTFDAGGRRAAKGMLVVGATVLAFAAAARPQYGKEKQLVPATKVDVVIVLDFSKSMYATDIAPNRITRAKAEVAELVEALPGARFGAVAFAGEPMGFPMTEDGAAVAQFFRGLEPNDMPVGGTAIGRALEHARELLRRDPKSKDHKRFVVLITDGEDLEGSPVRVAKSLGEDGTTVHVVQIGGLTPERIPNVMPDGSVNGWRMTEDGKFMTTELTERGQAQLKSVATSTPGGKIVRAQEGKTGISEITGELRDAMQSGEFAEHYEDVYADVYEWPLGAAILLLFLEALLTDAPRIPFFRRMPPPGKRPLPFAREAPRA
jgi:Ca-activated chloride channel family protein